MNNALPLTNSQSTFPPAPRASLADAPRTTTMINDRFRRIRQRIDLARGHDPLLRDRMQKRDDLVRLGSDYGGWVVPTRLLNEESVVYSGGVGEDITFDQAVIDRFHTTVYAFDPTPRSIAYVQRHAADISAFHFTPVGLWSSDTTLSFFAPNDPTHVSHSVLALQQTVSGFSAECWTVRHAMKSLGHDRITLLKLDIEGAEYEVLTSILRDGVLPSGICVEFHSTDNGWQEARDTLRKLRQAGFAVVAADLGMNYTLVLNNGD